MMSRRGCIAALTAACLLAAGSHRALADDRIEIFDAHLHYNWEPKPFYQLDEVLALFKKHRVTGILATSRPNSG
ncbi:MAG TPA: amidohydrolase, partial [Bradyrhizobium sp.]|nr:amidohydrolase [Bradyrhizobium sp.]